MRAFAQKPKWTKRCWKKFWFWKHFVALVCSPFSSTISNHQLCCYYSHFEMKDRYLFSGFQCTTFFCFHWLDSNRLHAIMCVVYCEKNNIFSSHSLASYFYSRLIFQNIFLSFFWWIARMIPIAIHHSPHQIIIYRLKIAQNFRLNFLF